MSGFGRSAGVSPPGGVVTHDRDIFTSAGNYSFTTANTVIVKKTVGSSTTVFLPANPTTGQEYTVKDGKGDAFTNPITVDGSGINIDGSPSWLLNVNYQSVTIFFDGSEYLVIGVRS